MFLQLPPVPANLARRKISINYAYGTVARGGKRAAIVFGVTNPRRAQRVV